MGARSRARDRDGEAEEGQLRLCAVSRARKPPDGLIRFVASPDGVVVPDLARRLPGRGIWVDATREAVRVAVRQKVFGRGLKQGVSVPTDLPDRIEQLMTRRLTEALSLAVKAGLAVAGFVKVEELIARRRAVVLLHASDAGADGVAKLNRHFKVLTGVDVDETAIVRELTSAEMSLAIGRPSVVHAAATEGGATRRLTEEARRLRRYRLGREPGAQSAPACEPNTGQA